MWKRRFKFMLPSIMMLVLCVGVLAVGVFAALSPTENKVAGKITINATNSPVTTKVYKEGEDGNKVFIKQMESRKGDTLDLSEEDFEFDTEGANKPNEVEPVVLYVEFSTTVAENLVVDTRTIQYYDGKTESNETISNLATVTKFHTYEITDTNTNLACFNKDHSYEIKCTFRLGDFVDEQTTIFFDMTFNICKASDYEGDGIDGVDYLYFGEYPQSEVTTTGSAADGTLALASNGEIKLTRDPNGAVFAAYEVQNSEENATGNAIYLGSDGNRYVEIYDGGASKYYLIEPLKWRILAHEKDGEDYSNTLLMCDVIIEQVQFYSGTGNRTINGQTIYANNYEHSTLRSYLNNTFYNNAFNSLQQQLVKIMDIDNSWETIGTTDEDNKFVCNDILANNGTGDPVFALSFADLVNENYRFEHNTGLYNDSGTYFYYASESLTRLFSASGYAKATGVSTYDLEYINQEAESYYFNDLLEYLMYDDGYDFDEEFARKYIQFLEKNENCGGFYTRSPHPTGDVWDVSNFGIIYEWGVSENSSFDGAVPALRISLK